MKAILGAMDGELHGIEKRLDSTQALREKYPRIISGNLGATEVLLVRTGVGKVMSASATAYVVSSYRPDTILYVGIAGALRNEPAIGDIVIARDSVQHDLDARVFGFERGEIPYEGIRAIPSSPHLVSRAATFLSDGITTHVGRILTGDRFLTTARRRDHAYLTDELDGWAVDMEGAAAATVAWLEGIDFLLARIISDRADGRAPEDFSTFLPKAAGTIADFAVFVFDYSDVSK